GIEASCEAWFNDVNSSVFKSSSVAGSGGMVSSYSSPLMEREGLEGGRKAFQFCKSHFIRLLRGWQGMQEECAWYAIAAKINLDIFFSEKEIFSTDWHTAAHFFAEVKASVAASRPHRARRSERRMMEWTCLYTSSLDMQRQDVWLAKLTVTGLGPWDSGTDIYFIKLIPLVDQFAVLQSIADSRPLEMAAQDDCYISKPPKRDVFPGGTITVTVKQDDLGPFTTSVLKEAKKMAILTAKRENGMKQLFDISSLLPFKLRASVCSSSSDRVVTNVCSIVHVQMHDQKKGEAL
ncbi:hypothetical protein EK904_008600, partial [Melospiza melodia maxima]